MTDGYFKILVIGASLGGGQALEVILSGLPKDFKLPVVIAQHRHKETGSDLHRFLQQSSALKLTDAEDKEAILPGHVYFAPADYHLLVELGNFALSTDSPLDYARPSIDMLFESAADAYGNTVIGIILTGASRDGAQGLAKIKARGGVALVQDPATAERETMPAAALAAVPQATVLPLKEIAPFLLSLCQPQQR